MYTIEFLLRKMSEDFHSFLYETTVSFHDGFNEACAWSYFYIVWNVLSFSLYIHFFFATLRELFFFSLKQIWFI